MVPLSQYNLRLRGESGIAIGPILFIVAILAILAAAIAAGSGSFASGTASESASTQAATIIQVGSLLKDAVQRVTLENGCADTQISFSNPIVTAANGGTDVYANANAPANKSCHVFDAAGGAITFPVVKASTVEAADNGYFVFEGSNFFYGLGNADLAHPALAAFLPIDSQATCQAINKQVGMDGYMGWDWYGNPDNPSMGRFTGTYTSFNGISDDGGTWKGGQIMGCIQQGVSTASPYHSATCYPLSASYFFYVVLLVR